MPYLVLRPTPVSHSIGKTFELSRTLLQIRCLIKVGAVREKDALEYDGEVPMLFALRQAASLLQIIRQANLRKGQEFLSPLCATNHLCRNSQKRVHGLESLAERSAKPYMHSPISWEESIPANPEAYLMFAARD